MRIWSKKRHINPDISYDIITMCGSEKQRTLNGEKAFFHGLGIITFQNTSTATSCFEVFIQESHTHQTLPLSLIPVWCMLVCVWQSEDTEGMTHERLMFSEWIASGAQTNCYMVVLHGQALKPFFISLTQSVGITVFRSYFLRCVVSHVFGVSRSLATYAVGTLFSPGWLRIEQAAGQRRQLR